MKISNLGVTGTPLASQPQADAMGTSREPTPSAPTPETSAYTPSAELTQLIGLVQQHPEVRLDRIQTAMQRLQQGDYQTPAAAGQTAAVMLSALD